MSRCYRGISRVCSDTGTVCDSTGAPRRTPQYNSVGGAKRHPFTSALRQSHTDEKRFRDESVGKLKKEYTRLQGRLEAMYEDRLDGRVDLAFFDRKSREWSEEQFRILREVEGYQAANESYMDAGIRILELSRNMHRLFAEATRRRKRSLASVLS